MKKIICLLSIIFAFSPFNLYAIVDKSTNDLNYFIGAWKCSGSYELFDNGQTIKSTFQNESVLFKKILSDTWIQGDYKDHNQKMNRCLYGANGDHFNLICYDQYGGYIHSRSSGWQDTVLRFEGEARYDNYKSEQVKQFTRVSNKTYKVISTITNKKENYRSIWQATCEK